jgi:hypothetical protein
MVSALCGFQIDRQSSFKRQGARSKQLKNNDFVATLNLLPMRG